MNPSYILASICVLVGGVVTFILTKYWIKIARSMGFTGKDMNKKGEKEVPEGGGVPVVLGISTGLLLYIFFKVFLISTQTHLIETFAVLSTILLAGFLGFIDDILGWKAGLKQWQKPLLTIPIALPMVVINAGNSAMFFPFFGKIEFGLLYPLMIVPVAIVGASNGFNLIAGLNGLEAGQASILMFTLALISYPINIWVFLLSTIALFSFLVFWMFNKFPSKIFPGDSFTYSVGALIAVVSILGNMERAGLILFIPYIMELLLKARSKFRAESFGIMLDRLRNRYDKIYSLTHVGFKFGLNEVHTVTLIHIIQVIFCVIALTL